MVEKIRVDKFLWAIRIFKTRNIAKEACEGGRVKLFGKSVKPAYTVNVGDQLEVNTPARSWIIVVTALAERRMAYSEAVKCYEDHTPEEKRRPVEKMTASFYTGKRLSKTGKPTKKQRRDMENFTGF